MLRYLDTSVLVSALTDEERTPAVTRWLAEASNDDVTVSDWVITEFSAAVSMKVRTGRHTTAEQERFLAAFTRMLNRSLITFDVPAVRFREAAKLADRHGDGLRAGDALHLAVAVAADVTLCTLDNRLAKAAVAHGLSVEDPSTT